MAFFRWFMLIIPSFLMEIVGRLLAPVLPFFANEDGWLPKWLWWFQTPDNPIDGDEGHWERWPGTGALATYVRRVAWLLRNVTYGFHINVLGVKVLESDYVAVCGDPKVGDQRGISGWCRWNVFRNGKLIAWQFYFVWHYQTFGVWKCVRIGAGWKCWSAKPFTAQHWIYFHPCKGSGRQG